jgi:O-antigen ligase
MITRKGIGAFEWLDLCLCFAVATIPWYYNLNSQALILFCVVAAFKNNLADKKRLLTRNYYWLLPVVYYIVVAASILWDSNGFAAAKVMEKHTSFLVLPFAIASVPAFSARAIKAALFSFVISVIAICLLCLVFSYKAYLVSGDSRLFFYHYLSQQMDLNAIYLSMFVLFSILIILYYCFIIPGASMLQKWLLTPVAAFLAFMILLLSSKMDIFLLLLTMMITVLYIFYLHRMLLRGIVFGILLIIGSGFLLWQLPYVRWRIQVTELKQYQNTSDDQNGLAARGVMWKSATGLIAKRPIQGYGLQNGSEQLIGKYREYHFDLGVQEKYDAHNVYLQTLLNTGILGLLPLLLVLMGAVGKAVRDRNYLFLIFSLTLTVQCMTDSLLEVQKGIVFFLLFLLLFYYHSPNAFKNSIRKS